MKFIIVVLGIVVAVSAKKQGTFKIPPESLSKLHNFAMPCVEKFNVDPSLMRKVGDPTFPRDEASSKFLFCYAENSNFIDKEGHMNADRITAVLGDHPLKEDVRKAITKCNDVTKENPLATAIAMHQCYIDTSPLIYEF